MIPSAIRQLAEELLFRKKIFYTQLHKLNQNIKTVLPSVKVS